MLKTLTKYDYREQLCAALRSGKYKQVQGGVLSWHNNEVCALGVGVKEGLFGIMDYRADCQNKLGIDPYKIITMNDGPRGAARSRVRLSFKNFAEIADWIEAQP